MDRCCTHQRLAAPRRTQRARLPPRRTPSPPPTRSPPPPARRRPARARASAASFTSAHPDSPERGEHPERDHRCDAPPPEPPTAASPAQVPATRAPAPLNANPGTTERVRQPSLTQIDHAQTAASRPRRIHSPRRSRLAATRPLARRPAATGRVEARATISSARSGSRPARRRRRASSPTLAAGRPHAPLIPRPRPRIPQRSPPCDPTLDRAATRPRDLSASADMHPQRRQHRDGTHRAPPASAA